MTGALASLAEAQRGPMMMPSRGPMKLPMDLSKLPSKDGSTGGFMDKPMMPEDGEMPEMPDMPDMPDMPEMSEDPMEVFNAYLTEIASIADVDGVKVKIYPNHGTPCGHPTCGYPTQGHPTQGHPT